MSILRPKTVIISTVLLAFLAWASWFVVSAYTTQPTATNVKLSGVELVVETQKDLGPSPLSIAKIAPFVPQQSRANVLAFVDETPVTEDLGAAQILGGRASIRGVVRAGGTPIAEAIVRIERETNAGLVSTEITTDSEGQYEIKNVRGGRYRVRAYLPFKYASGTVETVFIEDFQTGEGRLPWKTKTQSSKDASLETELDLSVKGHTGSYRLEVSYPEFAYADTTSRVAVAITASEIDAEGVVVVKPVSGIKVDLGNAKGYKWTNNQTKNTDANGLADFSFTCSPGSSGSLPATASGRAFKLEQVSAPAAAPQADSEGAVQPTFERVEKTVSLKKTIVMPACQVYIPPVVEEPTETVEGEADE